MTSGERLRDGLRRSRLLLLITIVCGLGAAFLASALEGAQYEASAAVYVSTQDASAILGGNGVDVATQNATDTSLGDSSAFRDRVTAAAGDAGTFTVSADDQGNVLSVDATAPSFDGAIDLANTAARTFVAYRGEVQAKPLAALIAGLQAQLKDTPKDGDLRGALSRARIAQSLARQSASVSDTATFADKTRPKPARNIVVGLIAGLVVGLLIMAAREGLSSRIRGEDDVENILGVPVIATVGRLARSERDRPAGPAFDRIVLALRAKTALDDSTAVGIVSAVAGEGRTTTVAGIVATLAAQAANVVAADTGEAPGDFGRHFDETVPLFGELPASATGGLAVVPAADRAETALLRPGAFIEALRADADWVLLDTPPALDSSLPEDLARRLDVTLIVVRPSVVSRADLDVLARQISRWPTRPHGVVLVTG